MGHLIDSIQHIVCNRSPDDCDIPEPIYFSYGTMLSTVLLWQYLLPVTIYLT